MKGLTLLPLSGLPPDSGSLQDVQNGQSILYNCHMQGKHCVDIYSVHIWDKTENERIQKGREGLSKDPFQQLRFDEEEPEGQRRKGLPEVTGSQNLSSRHTKPLPRGHQGQPESSSSAQQSSWHHRDIVELLR